MEGSSANEITEFWKCIDLEELRQKFYKKFEAICEKKEISTEKLQNIENLARDFKNASEEKRLTLLNHLLEGYDEVAKDLVERADLGEVALFDAKKWFDEAVDPYPALDQLAEKLKGDSPSSSAHADSTTGSFSHLVSAPRYTSDFKEIAKIGKGGYGEVVIAVNNVDKTNYAIKKIRFNEDESEKVLREVDALCLLKHKHIIRYYQAWIERSKDNDVDHTLAFEQSNSASEQLKSVSDELNSASEVYEAKEYCLYIQMELCSRTLHKHLKEKIDEETACKFLKQIIKALSYLHDQGIIHRDLCTDNILLDQSMNNIKISDFGLAKMCKEDNSISLSADELGHALYRAPEMYSKGSDINKKVDVFSLGMIVLELFYYFKTGMERSIVLKNLKESDGELPGKCKEKEFPLEFIRKLLSENPSDRPSVKKILQDRPWVLAKQESAPSQQRAVDTNINKDEAEDLTKR